MLVEQILKAPIDALAAVQIQGDSITYGELQAQSRELAARLGSEPRLVLLEGSSSIKWLVAYVACLVGRHPVLVAPAGAESTIGRLSSTFAADVLLRASNGYEPEFVPQSRPKVLHPDLALMLSTSGSTGSAKCVRLSHANISENAASICEYLRIGPDERGVANLPPHYSYGLSVVNSHLRAGATVLLTDSSVIEQEFWNFLKEYEATSFQGVPHVFDLLSRIDFANQAPKTLRYFTQAGGRLAPEKVQHFLRIAEERAWRFYVMYGQTEATARMAYMPPEYLGAHPTSIGIPIPGGKFSVVAADGNEAVTGEAGGLVYEGPNVMMGYATTPEELSLDPMPARLVTGDLARVDEDGFYYITGRLSRFVKIFGNRIGLDDVERIISAEGINAVATGVDDHLLIVTREGGKQDQIFNLISATLKLPRKYFSVRVVDEYPLMSSGKIDYQSLRDSIDLPAESRWSFEQHLLRLFRPKTPDKAMSVDEVFSEAFGKKSIDENSTFRSLGGDSLTYVSVALGLESRIGRLPADWDARSIAQLRKLENESGETSRSRGKSVLSNLDTLRGLACLMVVLFHVIGEPDSGLKLQEGVLRWSVDSLKYFRMPLFAAMAGFFYAATSVERDGLGRFLKRRLATLMVPALCVTFIYWGVRRMAYGLSESLLFALLYGYLHLWFLYALMIMLAVAGALDAVFKPPTWVWGTLIIIAPILSVNMPPVDALGVSHAVNLFCYFALGVVLCRVPRLLRSIGFFVAALTGAVGTLALQQLRMRDIAVALSQMPYWHFLGGICCVMVMLYLVPRLRALEAISIYTYTIYLWHGMGNAAVRVALRHLHVENIGVIVVLGFLAGVIGPILFHIAIRRFPRMSSFLIGR